MFLWCCKTSIFTDQLPQAQQFTAVAHSVFKVHSPLHKNNLYLCEYLPRHFFSPQLRESQGKHKVPPACVQEGFEGVAGVGIRMGM